MSTTRLGLIIFSFLVVIVVSGRILNGPSKLAVSELKAAEDDQLDQKSNPALAKIIKTNLVGQKGDFSIYIEDLADNEYYSLNSSERFPSASLFKLFLLAAVEKQINKNVIPAKAGIQDNIDSGSAPGMTISEDTVLTAQKSHLIEVFGDTDFGYEDSPDKIEYTVKEAMERVGRISDNFAAVMLAEKIGWDQVQLMADDLGAKTTSIKSPITTSALDIAIFYKKLYKKEIVSVEASDRISEILGLSRINNRIPALLPEEVKVIHKTGELSGVRHDAGIVYLTSHPYIIVLMSQNLKYEDDGIELEAKISKDVYNYFKNKK